MIDEPFMRNAIEPDDLLKLVIEHADDDAPRLALADWLIDHDDPRGDFIQLQCQLAKIDPADPRRGDLESRETELMDQHRVDWTEALVALGLEADEIAFHRGMVESVTLDDFDLFFDQADELFQAAPLLSDVTFNNVVNVVLGNRLEIDRLVQSPFLLKLKSLTLMQCELGVEGTRALAASSNAGNIERLIVFNDPIGDEGVAALAESEFLPRLRRLTLIENEISAAGISPLVQSPLAARLVALWLSGNAIGDEGLQSIAASAQLAKLEDLTLADVGVSAKAAEFLARSQHLKNLKTLVVTDELLGGAGETILRERFGARFNPD